MDDGRAGAFDDDAQKVDRTGKRRVTDDHRKSGEHNQLLVQLPEIFGKSGTAQQVPHRDGASAGRDAPSAGVAHALNPMDWMMNVVQQGSSGIAHIYNDGVSAFTNFKPSQIAERTDPKVAVSIDKGRKIQEDIDAGRRTGASVKDAAEKQDLDNYRKFQETLKSVPAFEQNDFRASVESELHKRAEQYLQSNPGGDRQPIGAQSGTPDARAGTTGGDGVRGSSNNPAAETGTGTGRRNASADQPAAGGTRQRDVTGSRGQPGAGDPPDLGRKSGNPRPGSNSIVEDLVPGSKSTHVEPGNKLVEQYLQMQANRRAGTSMPDSDRQPSRKSARRDTSEQVAQLAKEFDRLRGKSEAASSAPVPGKTSRGRNDDQSLATRSIKQATGGKQAEATARGGSADRATRAYPPGSGEKRLADSANLTGSSRSSTARDSYAPASDSRRGQPAAHSDSAQTGVRDKRAAAVKDSPARMEKNLQGAASAGHGDQVAGNRALAAAGKIASVSLRDAVIAAVHSPALYRVTTGALQHARGPEVASKATGFGVKAADIRRSLSADAGVRSVLRLPPGAIRAVTGRSITARGVRAGRSAEAVADVSRRAPGSGAARLDPSGKLIIREPSAFTTNTRVDRRFILGPEMALAAVIAAAGIARRRPEARSGDGGKQAGKIEQGGKRAESERMPVIKEMGFSRKFSDREPTSLAGATRIDRRIAGGERALAEAMAARSSSAQRLDRALFGTPQGDRSLNKKEAGDGKVSLRDDRAGERGKSLKDDAARRGDSSARPGTDGKAFTSSAKVAESKTVSDAQKAMAVLRTAFRFRKGAGEEGESDAHGPMPVTEGGANRGDASESGVAGDGSSLRRKRNMNADAGDKSADRSMTGEKAVEDDEKEKEGRETEREKDKADAFAKLADEIVKQTREQTINRKTVLHRPTFLVLPEDTLVSIAETFFHDPELAWLIADLNQHNIKEAQMHGKRVVELKSRQLLELPVWEDIEEFWRNRPAEARAENLVTIVEHSQVDRELLDSALSIAMGVSSAGVDPFGGPGSQKQAAVRSGAEKVKWSFRRFLASPH